MLGKSKSGRFRGNFLKRPQKIGHHLPSETSSAFRRGHILETLREGPYLTRRVGHAHAFGGGRTFRARKPGAPFAGGPYRPRLKASTAVRADIRKHRLHAIRAERALEAANPCLDRGRRQVFVATLAVRSKR